MPHLLLLLLISTECSRSNMPTTLNFILPSHHRTPHLNLLLYKSCLSSLQLLFYTNSMALNPEKLHTIFFAQLREHSRSAAYTPLMLLVQPLHWTVILSYLELHWTPICLCPSTLNSCHSPVFIIFGLCVTYVVC